MTTVVSLSSYEYAAGSWVLRLTGQVSSLSALAERAVLRRLRFQLWLGDGAVAETSQGEEATTDDVGDVHRSHSPQFEVAGHGPDLVDLTHLVQSYVQHYLDGQDMVPRQSFSQGQMSLTPVGLTRHRLTVAAARRSAEVTMSLLQLSDLAAVLAQAEQAVEPWPEGLALAPQRRTWRRLPLWTGSVAAVLVAAVLGSQWLGQMPPSVVQSPTPTAETLSPGEEEVAQGVDAAPEGTNRVLDGEGPSLGTDPSLGGDSSAGQASDTLPSPRSAPASPLAASPAGPLPDAALPSPSPTSGAPAVSVPPSAPQADAPRRPGPPPGESAAAPLASAPADALPPVNGSDLAGPNSTAAELPAPAAAPARISGPEERSAPESSSENADPAFADSASVDWQEALRATLQENWQPIPGLVLPLRYRLSLGPAGEVLAIAPLTPPSRQYLTQIRLPQVGDVLPNLQRPNSTTVDIELLPSGDVRIYPGDLDSP
jgi:hypothetical protein